MKGNTEYLRERRKRQARRELASIALVWTASLIAGLGVLSLSIWLAVTILRSMGVLEPA